MSKRLLTLLPFMLTTALAAPELYVAYPPDTYSVAYDHVLIEGHVSAGATLSVNGRSAPVGPDGLFILWQPLSRGANALRLVSSLQGQTVTHSLNVTSRPAAPLPATPTAIAPGSVTPASDIKRYTLAPTLETRTVTVRFQGSPGGQASFMLGARGPFPMVERKAADYPGSDPATLAGVYEGSYVLTPNDRFANATVSVRLQGPDGRSVRASAAGHLSVAESGARVGIESVDIAGRALNAGTTVWRDGAGGNYIVFPRTGEKTVVIGEDNDTYLARLSDTQTVNIPKTQLRLLPPGTPLPGVRLTTASTTVTAGGSEVRLNLSDRVPFTIEQTAAGEGQHLELRLYHTQSDLDSVVSAFPDPLLQNVRWFQDADGVLRLRLDLNSRQQWGFDASYQGNTLVLRLRRPPVISASQPLAGHRIVIDPGHGGRETGGAGALGTPEKDLTLIIAGKLATALRAMGASVTLTRSADTTLDLYSRDLFAESQNAELLVSIHANALPDGVNPAGIHGAGGYYYWPQARPLVDSILAAFQQGFPEVGLDGAHYQNLALTRPSTQLSVLIETAYLTDPDNLRLLMSPAGQDRFAATIAAGIQNFYAGQAGGTAP